MRKRLLALLTCFLLCASLVMPVGAAEVSDKFTLINQIALYIEQNYKFNTTSELVKNRALEYMLKTGDTDIDNILDAMMDNLDDYSRYFTEEEYADFTEALTASLRGIGVSVRKVKGGCAVLDVLSYSPAEKAGVKKFDVITEIDGKDIADLSIDEISSLIRGEEATTVKIAVKRIGQEQTLYFDIIRANVEESTVSWKKLDDETAYIEFTSLTLNSDVFMKAALDEIDKCGIKKIVLDLRDNTGGYLDATVNICSMFVPEGPVGYIDYKDPEKLETFYSDNKKPKYSLAVLINGNTASGAELLSGTIQDYGIGKLFGEKSFGKGTVQTTLQLKNGGAIKLTIGKYYTAKKQDVAKDHVNPDVKVENSYMKMSTDGFEELDFDNAVTLGSEGKHVLAIEQRLELLGLMDSSDEVADSETMDAIALMKTYYGEAPSYETDINFLSYLNSFDYESHYTVNDRQLEAAYNYLKGIKK